MCFFFHIVLDEFSFEKSRTVLSIVCLIRYYSIKDKIQMKIKPCKQGNSKTKFGNIKLIWKLECHWYE